MKYIEMSIWNCAWDWGYIFSWRHFGRISALWRHWL